MGSIDPPPATKSEHDVLIIGAGLSGICALYHIRNRFPDWRVRVLEAGSGAGGTWYWNRYPGARFDSESVSYGYSFDQELLDEWHWKEAFSAQKETLRYIERVCEKNNLHKDIQYDTRIQSAYWQDERRTWTFFDENDNEYTTRFFVSCMGFLSSPTLPKIPGIDSFKGNSFHTSRWPHNLDIDKEFAGKRIGVIGTGATGIQITTELTKHPELKSLHVFQRTANWAAPLRNSPITAEQMAQIHLDYDSILKYRTQTPSGFLHQADPRKSLELSEAERLAHWEKLYAAPGMGKWLGGFSDTYTDRAANKLYSDFMASKIRSRVHDPTTAEVLVPKDHGFGTRRIPLESGYFEAFNRANVHLVDLKEAPIECITKTGIRTTDGKDYPLNVLIFATGFDAITGAFNAIDWHAKDNRPLIATGNTAETTRAIWPDYRPYTFLGMTVPAMPNMFMVMGPHQPFGNAGPNIEHAVSVVTDLLLYCRDNGITYVEAEEKAADEWTEHVYACSKGGLMNEVESWMTGVNSNVEGKTVRNVARYAGSAIEYRRRCKECKESGWKGLRML